MAGCIRDVIPHFSPYMPIDEDVFDFIHRQEGSQKRSNEFSGRRVQCIDIRNLLLAVGRAKEYGKFVLVLGPVCRIRRVYSDRPSAQPYVASRFAPQCV